MRERGQWRCSRQQGTHVAGTAKRASMDSWGVGARGRGGGKGVEECARAHSASPAFLCGPPCSLSSAGWPAPDQPFSSLAHPPPHPIRSSRHKHQYQYKLFAKITLSLPFHTQFGKPASIAGCIAPFLGVSRAFQVPASAWQSLSGGRHNEGWQVKHGKGQATCQGWRWYGHIRSFPDDSDQGPRGVPRQVCG